jgi:HEAT repeat protein
MPLQHPASLFPFLLDIFVQAGPEIRDSLAGGVVSGPGKNSGDELGAGIKHNRTSIRQGAAIALIGRGKKAVPVLTEALHDREPVVQQAAAESPGSMKCEPESMSDRTLCH